VRKGADEAEVAARFEVDPATLTRAGIEEPVEDGALLLRRTVGADGRSRAWINDRPVTLARLREVGGALADLHGQHEQQQLRREETHLDHLDAYGGLAAEALAAREAWRRHVEARDALTTFRARLARAAGEREESRRRLEELTAARLREGEEEELGRERRRVAHAERLAEAAGAALTALAEGSSHATGLLAAAERALEQGTRLDPGLAEIRRQVDEALVAAEEASRELGAYLDGLPRDPARLEEIEGRLAALAALQRKYRGGVADLIREREELSRMLDATLDTEERLGALEAAAVLAEDDVAAVAGRLGAARRRAAAALGRDVTRELRSLGMGEARFRVDLVPPRPGERLPRTGLVAGPRGAEEAVFLLAANPGEAEGPLAAAASGGEASRVMLALRNVLRAVDPVPVVVFDEVDAGIGGLVAQAVGARLAAVAAERQVLVVTHLAVIAGRASHHLRLVKTTDGKRTRLTMESLDAAGREAELARMLAGSRGGDDARRTARALMEGEGA
jgi:DNA repair protein RecN (Recombination protein N)